MARNSNDSNGNFFLTPRRRSLQELDTSGRREGSTRAATGRRGYCANLVHLRSRGMKCRANPSIERPYVFMEYISRRIIKNRKFLVFFLLT